MKVGSENMDSKLYNLEAEVEVLGGIIMDNQCIHKLCGLITFEDFYYPRHKLIYNLNNRS